MSKVLHEIIYRASTSPVRCDDCGEIIVGIVFEREEWDSCPTDRGTERRDYIASYCRDCRNEREKQRPA